MVNPVTAEITHLAHTATGLLTDLTDPKGNLHHFDYQADGRLVRDTNATPGSPGTTLANVSTDTGWTYALLEAASWIRRAA